MKFMPDANHPTTQVLRVGDPGVVIPQETLGALGLKEGDRVVAVRTRDGLKFVPYGAKFAQVMEFTRDFMHRHADAMRKLAE